MIQVKQAASTVSTSNLVKSLPSKQLARHAHPFITKVALRVNEPLEDKGGLAHVLYRKAGATTRAASYRNIMFENDIIKHHHKFLRSRYSHLLQICCLATQCGGMPNRTTSIAIQMVRMAIQTAAALKKLMAILFVDVKAAFYRVLRQVVMPMRTSPDDMQDLIDTMEIPIMFVQPLTELLAKPDIISQACDDQHLNAILTDANTNIWFCINGSAKIAQTKLGT